MHRVAEVVDVSPASGKGSDPLPELRAPKSPATRRFHAIVLSGVFAGLASGSSHAQAAAAATGCPQFHCTPEATGAMSQPILASAALLATTTLSDPALGTLLAQGCSGDGTRLACLVDSPTGTLKIVDTTARPTLRVVHSDKELMPGQQLKRGWSNGQVPFMFSDGRVGAGDSSTYRIYDFGKTPPTMTSVALPVPARAVTMGLTDLANGYGVVARSDGTLTFIDMARGSYVGALSLKDPNGTAVKLSSPPSASNGVLYAAATGNDGHDGYLFAVSMDGSVAPTTWNWCYPYIGTPGASPVEATPWATGYSNTLVLLHVPGTGTPQLQAILDKGSSATLQWYIPLARDLAVAPSVDDANRRVYFIYKYERTVYGCPLDVDESAPAINAACTSYDLQAMTGLPALRLNGHLGAVQTPGLPSDFTLLLAATTETQGSPGSEYLIALRPIPAPGGAWSALISTRAAVYTAAWNLSPSNTPGIYCPVVVLGGNSRNPHEPRPNGLVLACDH